MGALSFDHRCSVNALLDSNLGDSVVTHDEDAERMFARESTTASAIRRDFDNYLARGRNRARKRAEQSTTSFGVSNAPSLASGMAASLASEPTSIGTRGLSEVFQRATLFCSFKCLCCR